jgi:hypothetical protein
LLGRLGFRGRAFTTSSASDLLNEAKKLAPLGNRDFVSGRRLLLRLALVGHLRESKGMPCVFCGATQNMSKEHVWPDWVRSLLPAEVLDRGYTYVYEDRHGEFRRVPGQPLFKKRVRSVCEPCNNEWMGRREDAVKPYAAGMLIGRGRELHAEGQIAIATWGALKAFVAQRSFRQEDPFGRIPEDHYRDLYETRDQPRLPEQFTVYTAKAAWSSKAAEPGFFRLNGLALGGKKRNQQDGYLLTFTVLDLVVQVLRVFGDDRAEFIHRPGLSPSVARIWPTVESFTWPPGPALTKAGILAVAGAS